MEKAGAKRGVELCGYWKKNTYLLWKVKDSNVKREGIIPFKAKKYPSRPQGGNPTDKPRTAESSEERSGESGKGGGDRLQEKILIDPRRTEGEGGLLWRKVSGACRWGGGGG